MNERSEHENIMHARCFESILDNKNALIISLSVRMGEQTPPNILPTLCIWSMDNVSIHTEFQCLLPFVLTQINVCLVLHGISIVKDFIVFVERKKELRDEK